MSKAEYQQYLLLEVSGESLEANEAEAQPEYVRAAERLHSDMRALSQFLSSSTPVTRKVRSREGRRVVYTFGDASEAGFGRTLQVDGVVYYECGQWGEYADNKSSNWREARNLLDGLRRALEAHPCRGLEVFIFTDNTTAESVYWKGYSSNRELSEIVLGMRLLEMEYDLVLHVTHVSGSRMISQGTDGLLRADHSAGVMAGMGMTYYIPLNESAFDRSTVLRQKLERYLRCLRFDFLTPEQWFDEHHCFGNFIWSPPPAAADAVVDLLGKAKHKRPECMHVVLVPRLMTGRWHRLMSRATDFWFRIEWPDVWDLEQHHEPLLCFVSLPLCVAALNLQLRRQVLDDMERLLPAAGMREVPDGQRWSVLRQLLLSARRLCALPK